MKLFAFLPLLAGLVLAAPLEKRAAPVASTNSSQPGSVPDVSILQFALQLEYLELNLYLSGLADYDEAAFEAAGYQSYARFRFTEIASQEYTHIATIRTAIEAQGQTPGLPCKYSFPYTDVKSWLVLVSQVDGVGPNAYLGASGLLADRTTQVQAVSILSTESRHNSWVRADLLNDDAFPQTFEQVLSLNEVYTIASAFIVKGSCPSSNPALPVKAFPALNVTNASPTAPFNTGDTVDLATKADLSSVGTIYAVFLANNNKTAVETDGKSCIIPDSINVKGQTYLLLSSSKNATDSTTLAGPTVVDVGQQATTFPYDPNLYDVYPNGQQSYS